MHFTHLSRKHNSHKHKSSSEGYNLACILTFPQYQKCGFGKFIISLSYELTKLENKTGSPEKPLSDLGKLSYRSYWTHVLMVYFANHDVAVDTNITQISSETGIRAEDIISTLQYLDMIKVSLFFLGGERYRAALLFLTVSFVNRFGKVNMSFTSSNL